MTFPPTVAAEINSQSALTPQPGRSIGSYSPIPGQLRLLTSGTPPGLRSTLLMVAGEKLCNERDGFFSVEPIVWEVTDRLDEGPPRGDKLGAPKPYPNTRVAQRSALIEIAVADRSVRVLPNEQCSINLTC